MNLEQASSLRQAEYLPYKSFRTVILIEVYSFSCLCNELQTIVVTLLFN